MSYFDVQRKCLDWLNRNINDNNDVDDGGDVHDDDDDDGGGSDDDDNDQNDGGTYKLRSYRLHGITSF